MPMAVFLHSEGAFSVNGSRGFHEAIIDELYSRGEGYHASRELVQGQYVWYIHTGADLSGLEDRVTK